MQRIFTVIVLMATAIGLIYGVSTTVTAQEVPMDEAHVERIRANCSTAKATLAQLHASDALLRVNRGQLYESVSTQLMANLNSRIALNRLQGASLIQIASEYERHLQSFRTVYQNYEEQMSDLLRIDCMKQPVAFYDVVAEVRDKRAAVHESVLELNDSMQAYLDEFTRFEAGYVAAVERLTS